MNKAGKYVQRYIIYALIIMMFGLLVLTTIELGYYLVKSIFGPDHFLVNLDQLMDLFGIFMLVLIGIELLDTIKVYLKENVVHVEVVVLVAIIAIARKVVVLKIEDIDGLTIIGIALIIVALAVAYYFIRKAGLMECRLDDEKTKVISREDRE
jgi:uncharacterized membrane protein (DUF373 family)